MRLTLLIFPLCLMCISAIAQGDNKETNFPKTEEIQLATSQAERAFDQYDRTIALETTLLALQHDKNGLDKDRELVKLARKLVGNLRKNPDSFHGVGGLLLLSTLDDASRNSALCTGGALTEVSKGLLAAKGLDKAKALELMQIAQACQNVSDQLYTISENVHALMVRELEGQETIGSRAFDAISKCEAMMKEMKKQQADSKH